MLVHLVYFHMIRRCTMTYTVDKNGVVQGAKTMEELLAEIAVDQRLVNRLKKVEAHAKKVWAAVDMEARDQK